MSFTPLTVLVTSAGRRVELLACLREDAQRIGCGLRLLAADSAPELSAACRISDRFFTLPRCTDPDYGPALCELCRAEGVGLVVPTIDPELLPLAAVADELAKGGTLAAVSRAPVIRLARDKILTAEVLGREGIPVPRTASLADFLATPGAWPLPLIAKPVAGSNSQGLHRLRTEADLRGLPSKAEGYLVQEWVQGREFSVNFFFDRAGRIRSAVPHERLEVRSGEVSKGRTTRLPNLAEVIGTMERVFAGGYGPLCFQGILTPTGKLVVFEVNARFGGGFPLTHRAGGRFTQWLIEDALGWPATADDTWEDGVTMLRYDAAVFLRQEGD